MTISFHNAIFSFSTVFTFHSRLYNRTAEINNKNSLFTVNKVSYRLHVEQTFFFPKCNICLAAIVLSCIISNFHSISHHISGLPHVNIHTPDCYLLLTVIRGKLSKFWSNTWSAGFMWPMSKSLLLYQASWILWIEELVVAG